MTTEEKELLLKDLCARSPYGVILDNGLKLRSVDMLTGVVSCTGSDRKVEHVRPYLRPMSSMTEEEKEEMHNLLSPKGTAIYENDGIALPINHCGEFVPYEFMNRIIQYLLKHHFDFIGLIPQGLAIAVTKENNPYK